MIVTRLLVLTLSMLFASVAHSEEPFVPSIDILEYGMFEATVVKEQVSEGTSLGAIDVLKEVKLVKQTTDIPGKLGNRFGIRIILKETYAKGKVMFLAKVLHPKTVNPKTKEETTLDQWKVYVRGGQKRYVGWTFDYPWEIVPGKWTIQLWHNGDKITEKTFNIHL